MAPESPSLFSPGSWAEGSRITAVLRKETVGGALLLVATVIALVWANVWTDSYFALLDVEVGPAALHLNLTLATWAADGLLAIFFFVAGLELKREFVAGDLRDPKRAVVPIAAAVGGMIVPALVYFAIAGSTGPKGWAIPTATDIAFALAVLAVISTHLPTALRTFLLTLAVVDDLLAITVIALFYSKDLHLQWFLLALLPLALFALLVQRGISHWYLLLPLAFATWALVHASGIHATVAGVLLGFMVPVRPRRSKSGKPPPADETGMAEHFEHLVRPVSAGFAVPVFAFFSAGVVLGGIAGLKSAFADPIAVGIIAGLLVGKPIGIVLATFITSKVDQTAAAEGPDLARRHRGGDPRRHRVHRVAADRRAGVRRQFRGRRPRQDRRAGRVRRSRGDRRDPAANPEQALPGAVGGREPGHRSRRHPGHLSTGVALGPPMTRPNAHHVTRSRHVSPTRKAPIRRALIRRPSPRLADGLLTHIDRVAVDPDLARQQWAGYVGALTDAGWETVEVPAADDCPDSVFVEDTVVMVGDTAVFSRPGADQRKPEIDGTAVTLTALGYPIERMTGGTLDGGDVLKVGTTIYVGRTLRTNAAGIAEFRRICEPLGFTVIAVPVSKVLHLKSAVTALPDGTIIGYPALGRRSLVLAAFPAYAGGNRFARGGSRCGPLADGVLRAAVGGADRRPGLHAGHRRHLRVRETRGLRHLPVRAAAVRAADLRPVVRGTMTDRANPQRTRSEIQPAEPGLPWQEMPLGCKID